MGTAFLTVTSLVLMTCVARIQCCHRRQPPTFSLRCPSSRTEIAPSGKTGVRVSWSQPPVPNKNSIGIAQIEGPMSGSYLTGPATYRVQFKVTYNRGYRLKSKQCSFDIYVRVITCPLLPVLRHGYRQCSTFPRNIYGASCTHSCMEGRVLSGPAVVRCRQNGQWNAAFPTCEPISCGDPGTVERGSLTCPQGHTYPQVCQVNCDPGFRPLGASFLRCQLNGRWTQAERCVDVQPPKFPNGCPASQRLFAGALGSPVTLTWEDPPVTDNDQVKTLSSSIPQGTQLGPGFYVVSLVATDRAENTARCIFTVTVSVRRCLPLNSPSHGQVTCSDGYVEGSKCTVTCDRGYQLQGQDTLTCQSSGSSGQWSHSMSSCQGIECTGLPVVKHGYVSCAAGRSYRSVCLLNCDQGFQREHPTITQCREDGTWSTIGTCKDVSSPEFVNGCPADIQLTASRLGEVTLVTWDTPEVKDNAGPNITLKCVPRSGSEFDVGSHKVRYTASDASGNEARCSFKVTVTRLTCGIPDLEPNSKAIKAMIYRCPNGYVYGATCSLVCVSSYPLTGPSNITCEKDVGSYPPIASWRWDGDVAPDCIITTCPQLAPPQNGALSCFLGNYAKVCYMSCNDPYDVPAATNSLFMCSNTQGRWIPSVVPGCTVKRPPNGARVMSDVFYYADDCNQSMDALREAFIFRLNQTNQDGCSQDARCTVENVEVICGPVNRQRRSADLRRLHADPTSSRLPTDLLVRLRRETEQSHKVVIKFSILVEQPPDSNLTQQEQYQAFQATKTSLYNTLLNQSRSGDLDIDGLTLDDDNPVAFPTLTPHCLPGTVGKEYNGTFYCVGCSAGHYEKSGECHHCPLGRYSEVDNATTCLACPPGWSTRSPAATNSSMCQEQCQAGSMSSDGFQPCAPCPLGQYQSRDSALTCDLCPFNTWTENEGANGSHLCLPADVVLTNNSVTADVRGNWTSLTVSLWVSMTSNSSAKVTLSGGNESTLFSYRLHSSSKSSQDDLGNSTPSASRDFPAESWSRVTFLVLPPGAQRTNLSGDITVMTLTELPTSNTVLSVRSTEGKVSISGLAAYGRELSEEEMASGGTSCTADNSENLLTWLSPPEIISAPSECDAIDECLSSPCGEHGTCDNRVGGFECQCKDGWGSATCDTPPDPCYLHQCQNNATCVSASAGSNYTCLCPPGYAGDRCGQLMVDGGWGEWSEYTECSADCRGQQHRQRLCNNPPPSSGGANCTGDFLQTQDCGESVCVVTGNWSEWTTWSDCSATCEGGETTRQRTCNTSAESDTLRVECEGQDSESRACNTAACPVHGGWGNWSDWSSCSVTCGRGIQSRERSCDNPVPANGGIACNGSANETRDCQPKACPECSKLLRVAGTMMTCRERQSPSYLKTCQVSCLDKDLVPGDGLSEYRCGQNTSHLWNHQISPGPVLVKACFRRQKLTKVTYRQTTTMYAACDADTRARVEAEVRGNMGSMVRCAKLGMCKFRVQGACRYKSRKRDVPSLAVTTVLTFSNETNTTMADNSTNSAMTYEEMVAVGEESITQLALNDTQQLFTVVIGNQTISPDVNSTDFDLDTNCAPGEIFADQFCVQCPSGTMEVNGSCALCPTGEYQDEVGSTSCKPCPEGFTSDFPGLTNVTQCRPMYTTPTAVDTTPKTTAGDTSTVDKGTGSGRGEGSRNTGYIIAGVCGGVAALAIVVLVVSVVCYLYRQRWVSRKEFSEPPAGSYHRSKRQ